MLNYPFSRKGALEISRVTSPLNYLIKREMCPLVHQNIHPEAHSGSRKIAIRNLRVLNLVRKSINW
jgi:hypothetical protein